MQLRLITLCTAMLMASISPAHAVMEDYPSIKLQGLDKSVGRTITFEAKVGSTIQYGPLFIKINACRKAPPIEAPESAAFLQIWEVPPGAEKSEWVFSGWMFASSPALSAMDHPVYDVWVLDCTGREEPNEEAKDAETSEQADQRSLPAANENQPVENDVVPTDSEAEPEPAVETAPVTETDPQILPTSEVSTEIPVDGEADMAPDESIVPQQQTTPYDPNAPYSPQQQVPVTPVTPQEDGIYSPSQGRIVPTQPQPQQTQDLPPVY